MKWIYPVKISFYFFIALLFLNVSVVVSQSLWNYRFFDNNRYSYNNHPAVRRAKYLLGGTTESRQDEDQIKVDDKRLENSYHNAIQDPYAYPKQNDEYKGYNQKELQQYSKDMYAKRADENSISQADRENAKFVGASNQESKDVAESSRALGHFKLKRLKRLLRNRCLPFGRSSNALEENDDDKNTDQYGRFLWDLNVYNVYANNPPLPPPPQIHHDQYNQYSGCGALLSSAASLLGGGGFGGGGFGGGGFGGGLFSDPLPPVYPPSSLNNFLGFLGPGILQNALAATAPSLPPFNNPAYQSDPNVDPGYQQPQPQQPQPLQPLPVQPYPVRRPNQLFFDSAGAAPLTPAQLVGGVATTVNGLIQQLTGNVQPVYQQPYG